MLTCKPRCKVRRYESSCDIIWYSSCGMLFKRASCKSLTLHRIEKKNTFKTFNGTISLFKKRKSPKPKQWLQRMRQIRENETENSASVGFGLFRCSTTMLSKFYWSLIKLLVKIMKGKELNCHQKWKLYPLKWRTILENSTET